MKQWNDINVQGSVIEKLQQGRFQRVSLDLWRSFNIFLVKCDISSCMDPKKIAMSQKHKGTKKLPKKLQVLKNLHYNTCQMCINETGAASPYNVV